MSIKKWADVVFSGFGKGFGGYLPPLAREPPQPKDRRVEEFKTTVRGYDDSTNGVPFIRLHASPEDHLVGKRVKVRIEEIPDD